MNVIPKLAELLEHPERVSDVPLEAIPALCGKLKELDVALELRVALAGNHGQAGTSRDGDRLLDVKEAAAKLGLSKDYLYRNGSKLPFVVLIGRQVRYSQAGIDKFIKQRMGR